MVFWRWVQGGGAAGGLIQSWGEDGGWVWRIGGIGEDLQLADLLPWSEGLFTAFLSDEEGCCFVTREKQMIVDRVGN